MRYIKVIQQNSDISSSCLVRTKILVTEKTVKSTLIKKNDTIILYGGGVDKDDIF